MRPIRGISEDDIQNEMRAIGKLCQIENTHRNIVSVLNYGPLTPFLYFIDMELCDLNLYQWIYEKWDGITANELPFVTTELSPEARLDQVWDIMKDITQGVAFIHAAHEIHRDMKPSNG